MSGIDAYTKLALHCDGTDGATTFTDSSLAPHTVTANGNAQIDTAQSKFGGASALCDGTGDYLSAPDSADWDFAAADFTLDLWVRFNNKATNPAETFIAQYTTGQRAFLVDYVDATTELRFLYTTDGTTNIIKSVTWAPSNSVWYHIAVVRNGANLYFFVDGTQVGATQNIGADTIFNSTTTLTVGALSVPSNYLDGWIDEVRISKGIARWTSNFTPPAAAYAADVSLVASTVGTLTLAAAAAGSLTLTPALAGSLTLTPSPTGS